MKTKVSEDMPDKAKVWDLVEIVNHPQCRVVTLPDSTDSDSKVSHVLVYIFTFS